jgi:hypothetical protein
MRYKTIVLELLRQDPTLHRDLQRRKTLLQILEEYAIALRDMHLSWMGQLAQERPGGDPSQISSAALELALQDLRAALPPAFALNAEAPE